MSVNFEIITKDFEDALAKYKVACRKDWQFVVRQQSRIVGERLVKFTPPKTAAIGKRNVARDIGKVFADLSNTKWHDKSLDKMWRAGNFEGVKKALENNPNKLQMPVFKYKRILAKPVRNIHKAAISRSGRVPKNWHTTYAVAAKGELKKYVKRVQLQVGVAKSGWLAALVKLGGTPPEFRFAPRHKIRRIYRRQQGRQSVLYSNQQGFNIPARRHVRKNFAPRVHRPNKGYGKQYQTPDG